MTTNNPEVKRYNITTDNHYHPVSYETEQGYWVKYSSYEALQAEFVIRLDELSARNYELRMGLAEKTSECEKLRKDAEPDVSELVEALERIARHPRTRGDELGYAGCRNIAKEALAAHRKGGDV